MLRFLRDERGALMLGFPTLRLSGRRGGGGSGPAGGAAGLLLESGDYMLLESGDFTLVE